MQTRRLGHSGLTTSLFGLGCSNFGRTLDLVATRAVVERALDLGVTFFDTADTYGNRGGSETYLAEILGPRRKQIVLATKFGMPMDDAGEKIGASRRYIVAAVEASLKRLKTDYIDLYQQHQPDPKTPLDETLRALDDLVRAGKVRAVGCCNLSPADVETGDDIATDDGLTRFTSIQQEYNLLAPSRGFALLPALKRLGMCMIPYYPVAGGILSGRYSRETPLSDSSRFTFIRRMGEYYRDQRVWDALDRVSAFCAEQGCTTLQAAFAWLAARDEVGVIIAGASSPEQVAQNVQACSYVLPPEAVKALTAIAVLNAGATTA